MSDPSLPPDPRPVRPPSFVVPAQPTRAGVPPAGHPRPDGQPSQQPTSSPAPEAGAPQTRRLGSRTRKVLLVGVPVLLVATLGVGAAFRYAGRNDTPAASATPPASELTQNTPLSAYDQIQADKDAAKAAIGTAMSAQAAALLAGDKAKFLSFASSSAKRVAPWLADRFTSLRALRITQWTTTVDSVTSYSQQRWQANVDVKYCLAATCARPLTATLHSMWDLADRTNPQITEMFAYNADTQTPPWARSVLRARTGTRVVVAATSANANRLAGALATAEAAARVADRYAQAAPPDKYVVYLASATEWADWPDNEEGKWVAGVAFPDTQSVIINMSSLRTTPLDQLLRHELGHVSTLLGQETRARHTSNFWLTEGLADYIANQQKPFSAYANRYWAAQFIRTKWNGDLRVAGPTTKSSSRDAAGRYGAAFLAVTCLAQTYSQNKLLNLFQATAVQGEPLADAAARELGVPWTTANRTCATKIRKTASQG